MLVVHVVGVVPESSFMEKSLLTTLLVAIECPGLQPAPHPRPCKRRAASDQGNEDRELNWVNLHDLKSTTQPATTSEPHPWPSCGRGKVATFEGTGRHPKQNHRFCHFPKELNTS